ncbi:MAG: ThuA domain-containing protein, partial [Deinococcota bacterium]|nr:ThuA domain-containing protein [Deinococcota bacterium]
APPIDDAVVVVEDSEHPSTNHLPERWARYDEWYNFVSNPRARVKVLLRLDTSSYEGSTMGSDHPIAWYHDFDGGRSWYTGLGHTEESYREPLFLAHLLGGIRYAAGR